MIPGVSLLPGMTRLLFPRNFTLNILSLGNVFRVKLLKQNLPDVLLENKLLCQWPLPNSTPGDLPHGLALFVSLRPPVLMAVWMPANFGIWGLGTPRSPQLFTLCKDLSLLSPLPTYRLLKGIGPVLCALRPFPSLLHRKDSGPSGLIFLNFILVKPLNPFITSLCVALPDLLLFAKNSMKETRRTNPVCFLPITWFLFLSDPTPSGNLLWSGIRLFVRIVSVNSLARAAPNLMLLAPTGNRNLWTINTLLRESAVGGPGSRFLILTKLRNFSKPANFLKLRSTSAWKLELQLTRLGNGNLLRLLVIRQRIHSLTTQTRDAASAKLLTLGLDPWIAHCRWFLLIPKEVLVFGDSLTFFFWNLVSTLLSSRKCH